MIKMKYLYCRIKRDLLFILFVFFLNNTWGQNMDFFKRDSTNTKIVWNKYLKDYKTICYVYRTMNGSYSFAAFGVDSIIKKGVYYNMQNPKKINRIEQPDIKKVQQYESVSLIECLKNGFDTAIANKACGDCTIYMVFIVVDGNITMKGYLKDSSAESSACDKEIGMFKSLAGVGYIPSKLRNKPRTR